jgi:glutaminyl-tRNA synthetase
MTEVTDKTNPTETNSATNPDKTNPAAGANSLVPNFVTEIVAEDLRAGRYAHVVTRFPPEPNGYLHLGHATAICLDFSTAQAYGGHTNLRFDDTNPAAEDMAYVEAAKRDIKWLGFNWDGLYFASDYFERLFECAVRLIKDGKAYVDSLSEADIRAYRGTVTKPGRPSPYRERSVEENLDLFARMKAGQFADGAHVLRAKIDMGSANMKMRDPLLYRIRHAHHYRRGDLWRIYPMYDFAHPLSDAFEGVTHSLCTLEFVNNREVYDWLVDALFAPPRPQQYEFGRHNIEYVVQSKRKLIELVGGGYVHGWDDPRLPTLAGLRRRGVTPEAIRAFVGRIGVSRANSSTSVAALEHSIRDDLNTKAPRVMAVLEPLKVVIHNYPAGQIEQLDAPYWPRDVPKEGARTVPFSRELYIERGDFMEHPSKGFHRLSPGAEVRLRYAYVIRCDEVVKDASGNITELRCSYDPETLGRNPAGRKVKGTLHWVSAAHALSAAFRLYDRLFSVPNPDAGEQSFTAYLNPESLVIKRGFVEPSVANDPVDIRYQFERQGYFWQDADSDSGALVFNRIVTLKDTWAKVAQKGTSRKEETRVEKIKKKSATPKETRAPLEPLSPQQKTTAEGYLKLGLERSDAALLASDADLTGLFEAAMEYHDNPRGIANWLLNDLPREAKGRPVSELQLTPEHLAALVRLLDTKMINSPTAKEVFTEMLQSGEAPEAIVERRGLEQVTDAGALEPIVTRLIAENPDEAARYREGKTGLLGFFVGQVMRETKGKANPKLVQELVKRKLKG